MVDSPDGTGFEDVWGHSITDRIALGPQQGRKAFALQTVPAVTGANDGKVAKVAGFSIYAGVASEAHERENLGRCVATSRAGRSRLSGCRQRCRGIFGTVSKHVTVIAPRMSYSSRSTSWPASPPRCRHRESISRAIAGSLRRTTDCVNK